MVEVPANTRKLLVAAIGFEGIWVELDDLCNDLEIIIMLEVIYDFIPLKKINRKRFRRFKMLPELHLT